MSDRNPILCIIPPYIIEHLAASQNPQIRSAAIAHLDEARAIREIRATRHATRTATAEVIALVSQDPQRNREVYDAQQSRPLPGRLVRSEGEAPIPDAAANEAYDFSGDVYDFYDQVFQRSSLDNNGMTLISSVHALPSDNAFWNGEQVAYGDGDGRVFDRFTCSLDVVGHELTHGVQAFMSNLRYEGQSGALNEHFSDVFGILVRQWTNNETAAEASWVVAQEILIPAPTRRGIRDMENPGTAYVDDPDLGTDPQPAHMSDIYTGPEDWGGVHINSGIPNRAFVLTAQALGGYAWEIAGQIWYRTLSELSSDSQFVDCAEMTTQIATADYGTAVADAVRNGWAEVGITVDIPV